jgi:hypothetical protein
MSGGAAMRRGNPYRTFDTRSLLSARELLSWDVSDIDENPETWQYPDSSREFLVYQISLADSEIDRRKRLRRHPLSPSWPEPRVELADIKEAVDLEQFIERTAGVSFDHRGKRVWSACPLPGHMGDVTPSFCVTPEKQLWCCFGCHRGGDVFTFVEHWRDVSFHEAVGIVSDEIGLPRNKRTRLPRPIREGVMRVG